MILGITGHRPNHLGGYEIPNPTYEKVCAALRQKLEALRPNKIISGMAQGTDQWAVEEAIKLNIPFIAAIPCDNQDLNWPEESKKRYYELLELAEESVVVNPGPYESWKMHERDRWVVQNSDSLLGVWSGIRKGGTFATIQMGKKKAKTKDYQIHIINPNGL